MEDHQDELSKALWDTGNRKYEVNSALNRPHLWFDAEQMQPSSEQFYFNAILVYYDIWNTNDPSTKTTNLMGILFMNDMEEDSAGIGQWQNYEKLVQDENGAGNSYVFRINLKNTNAVVVDKSQIDEKRADYSFNDFYFRMYFQLLHTKVDFQNRYNVFLDIKDTCSGEKLEKMKKIMSYNSSIGTLQFIPSRESVFIQLADVLMGAINYNLRIQKGDVKGNVIAKLKLIEKIKRHSNISLNTTTPLSRNKFNLFFITLK